MSDVVVIKLGGNAIYDGARIEDLAQDLSTLRMAGTKFVIVHGGGPQIDAALHKSGIPHTRINGLRVTSPEAVRVVKAVLDEEVQPSIVAQLEAHEVAARGVSGSNVFFAVAHEKAEELGRVGEVVRVDTDVLSGMLEAGTVPVVSTIATGDDGLIFNINADTAAATLAGALDADILVTLTNVAGIFADYPNKDSLLKEASSRTLQHLLPGFGGGMRPKAEACLTALESGVGVVYVADGAAPHIVSRALSGEPVGTKVVTSDDERQDSGSPRAQPYVDLRVTGDSAFAGEGTRLWDEDGNVYTDFIGGLAVNVLGHAHPAIVEAVSTQIKKVSHVSNVYASEPCVDLAERLLALFGEQGTSGRVYFCNSGAEANEAAFKISRLTGRTKLVAADKSFHGRTMGALALTGQPTKREPFMPLPESVTHVPYGDVDALRAAVSNETAAVFLEPVQGEAGVIPAPPGYLKAAREITKAAGALLVIDEIQTGIGRTGVWFAFQRGGIEPDLVTVAKGLGGGLPIGACIGFGEAANMLTTGMHGSTFGGNPVSCAASLAVLDVIASEGLVERSATAGARLKAGVESLDHPSITGVRGLGLLVGFSLTGEYAKKVQHAAERAGFLLNAVQLDAIRLAPPLIIDDEEIDRLIAALPGIFDEATP